MPYFTFCLLYSCILKRFIWDIVWRKWWIVRGNIMKVVALMMFLYCVKLSGPSLCYQCAHINVHICHCMNIHVIWYVGHSIFQMHWPSQFRQTLLWQHIFDSMSLDKLWFWAQCSALSIIQMILRVRWWTLVIVWTGPVLVLDVCVVKIFIDYRDKYGYSEEVLVRYKISHFLFR